MGCILPKSGGERAGRAVLAAVRSTRISRAAEAQAAIELQNARFDREAAKKMLSQRMKEEFAPYGQRGREEAQFIQRAS